MSFENPPTFQWTKFLSRKFIITLAALVGVTLTVFNVEQSDEIRQGILQIGGAAMDMLIALGYQQAEAKVDVARATGLP